MELFKFKNCMREIYASHGKTPPTDAVMMAVWKRVEHIPDAFMEWATSRLADYDKLPGNLGLELSRALYADWKNQTGQTGNTRDCCFNCDKQVPGFFYFWRLDDIGQVKSGMLRCECNDDPALGSMPRMSKHYARSQGLFVMPPGYQGSPARFEMETFPKKTARTDEGTAKAIDDALRRPELEGPQYESAGDAYAAGY